MKIRLGALCCIFFVSAFSYGQMSVEDEIKVAKILIEYNQDLEAIGHFNAILIRDPENLEARLFRAGCLIIAFNEPERAQKDLDYCIKANYRPVQTAYYQAKILFQNGKYKEAVEEFEMACSHIDQIELYAVDEVYYFSGLARASAEDYEGSIRDYNHAQSHNALDYRIWLMRAESELVLNRLQAALLDVERAFELAPDNFSKGLTLYTKGEILLKQKDTARACTCFKDAVDKGHLLAKFRWEECPDYVETESLNSSEQIREDESPQTLDPNNISWGTVKVEERPKDSYFKGKTICDPYKLAVDAAQKKFTNIQGKLIEGSDNGSAYYASKLEFPEAKSAELLVIEGLSTVLQITYLSTANTEFDLKKSYDDLVVMLGDCLSNSGFKMQEQGSKGETSSEAEYTFVLYNTNYPLDDESKQRAHGILISISLYHGSLIVSIS